MDAINVRLTPGTDALAFSRDVNARLPGLSARPTTDAGAAAGPFRVLERFHLAIAIVTIIASTVFLLALTVMLVDERRETVGVLRLIGLPTSRVLVQVLLEGVLVAGAGSVVRARPGARVRGRDQPVLPVALRHGAALRRSHAVGGADLRADCHPARRLGHGRGVVARFCGATRCGWRVDDRAPPSPWRSLVRQPARATLGVLGVAAVGALLFDMLMLSHGLIVSMRDLLERTGFDIRVTASGDLRRVGRPHARHRRHAGRDSPAAAGGHGARHPIRRGRGRRRTPEPDRRLTLQGVQGDARPWTVLSGRDPAGDR